MPSPKKKMRLNHVKSGSRQDMLMKAKRQEKKERLTAILENKKITRVLSEKEPSWRTIRFTSDSQALTILEGLQEDPSVPLASLVKNLWVASESYRLGQPIEWLTPDMKHVGDLIVAGKHVNTLATDATFLAMGWCAAARPTQILLLADPGPHEINYVDFSAPLFESVTHLTIESPRITRALVALLDTEDASRLPSLTHLSFIITEMADPDDVLSLVDTILDSMSLSMLVVCLDSGLRADCRADCPLLKALMEHGEFGDALCVLPYAYSMATEWSLLVQDDKNDGDEFKHDDVWTRALVWQIDHEHNSAAQDQSSACQTPEPEQEPDWTRWKVADTDILHSVRKPTHFEPVTIPNMDWVYESPAPPPDFVQSEKSMLQDD